MHKAGSVSESYLQQICQVRSASETANTLLDGFEPQFVAEPIHDEEAAQLLHLANKEGTPIAVMGGGTSFSTGAPLEKLEWAISTQKLYADPVINTDDLLVIAKAGVPLALIQERLKEQGLFLPFDPGSKGTTIGGALALGGSGSHKLGYGSIKEAVLGMKVALADGKIYKFGGQTVKNVVGYDVGKIFVGARGSLGIITEVCLRVYPLPPFSKVILGWVENLGSTWRIAESLEKVRPTVVEFYDAGTAKEVFSLENIPAEGYVLLIKLSGSEPTVEKQWETISEVFVENRAELLWALDEVRSSRSVVGGPKFKVGGSKFEVREDTLWQQRTDWLCRARLGNDANKGDPNYRTDTGIKFFVPRVASYDLAVEIEKLQSKCPYRSQIMVAPLRGLVFVNLESSTCPEFFIEVVQLAKKFSGFASLTYAPVALRQEYYSQQQNHWDTRVKSFFDSRNILNPGKRP